MFIRRFKISIIICIFAALVACSAVPQTDGLGDPAQINQYQYASNIWDTLGSNFDLPDETPENPAVRQQINWYMSHPKYLQKIAEQSKPYLYYIYQQVKIQGLPAEFALLPMVESSYDPFAYSRVGASGLWQMMPGTASGFGLKVDWWYDGRRDIVASTNSALTYLAYLGEFFHGDWLLAAAAYDTGEGTVNNAIERNAKLGKPTDFWHLALSKETESYVPKLLALATIIKHPYEYPIDLPFVKNAPYLAEVNVGSQIDLARAAKMANMSLGQLAVLNPGYNRWATDPNGPHQLLLPIDKAKLFEDKLAMIPKKDLVTWKRYKVKSGDTIGGIAEKFKTSISLIQEVNQMKNNSIHLGHTILIPTSANHITNIVLKSERDYFTNNHGLPEINITNYIVKKGDTLDSISKKYHVTPRDIRFWNGLRPDHQLAIGEKFIIWPPHQEHHFYKRPTFDYTVKSGDTLIRIAERYHTSSKEIMQINHMHKSFLSLGQTLTIPGSDYQNKKAASKHRKLNYHTPKVITYFVKTGDTVSSIAKKHDVKVASLERWNQLGSGNHLKINQRLVIYQ